MLKLKNIHKSYQQGSQEFPILKGIDLHVKEGDVLIILKGRTSLTCPTTNYLICVIRKLALFSRISTSCPS